MQFHFSTALAGVLVLALGVSAQAQTYRRTHAEIPAVSPYDADLVTGRSAYVAPGVGRSVEANQTVMGLRVPDAQAPDGLR